MDVLLCPIALGTVVQSHQGQPRPQDLYGSRLA